jgi:hypothetical protein
LERNAKAQESEQTAGTTLSRKVFDWNEQQTNQYICSHTYWYWHCRTLKMSQNLDGLLQIFERFHNHALQNQNINPYRSLKCILYED